MSEAEVRRHNRIADLNLLGFLTLIIGGLVVGTGPSMAAGLGLIALSFVCARFYGKHAGIVWEWIGRELSR